MIYPPQQTEDRRVVHNRTNGNLRVLLGVTTELVELVHRRSIDTTRRLPVSGGLFEETSAAEERLRQMKELGSRVVRLASLCEEGGGGGGGDYYGTDGVESAEASDAHNMGSAGDADGSGGAGGGHQAGDGEVSVANLASNVKQWLSMLKSDAPDQS